MRCSASPRRMAGAVELNGIGAGRRPSKASPRGRRVDPGVAQGRGPHSGPSGLREHEPGEPRAVEPPRLRIAAARARRHGGDPDALRRPCSEQQPARPGAVRREPAEGAPGAHAVVPARTRHRRRADARRRRRSETRDLRAARRPGRGGIRRPPDLLGARGDHRARPSRGRHAGGRIVAEFGGDALDETAILAAAFGNQPGQAA